MKAALETGYRHIDGAWAYQVSSSCASVGCGSLFRVWFHIIQNEEEVGEALRASGVPRDQVWLTSKVRDLPSSLSCVVDECMRAYSFGTRSTLLKTLSRLWTTHSKSSVSTISTYILSIGECRPPPREPCFERHGQAYRHQERDG